MAEQEATDRTGMARVAMVRSPEFVGRDRELAVMAHALASPGSVVLIEGEAGMGKSRLVQEYLSTAQDKALLARSPAFRRPHTLGPLVDVLREAVDSVQALGLSGLAGALRPLLPEWAAQLPPAPEPAEDSTAARYRLFRALAELTSRLNVAVLVLEDAHWADEATLEFLLFLAVRPVAQPVSLVITYRPEDVPADSPLPRLARLAAGGSGRRLTLDGLDQADTASLVSSMLAGEHVSEEFARFMREHTGGVPLAVEESVRLMAARADLTRRGGQWVRRELADIDVPPAVRDAVLERVNRLTPDARTVLHAVAVIGEPAAEAAVVSVAGADAQRVRAGLSEALACGLLAEDRRDMVSFGHVLACRAVYETIPGPDRRLLHGRAGRALAALSPPPVSSLARHFRMAGDVRQWRRYGERAADLALAAGDETTAALLLHDLVTTAGLSASAVARLAGKMVLLAVPGDGRLRDLAQTLRGFLDTGALSPAQEGELRFHLGRLLVTMDENEAAHAELERALPYLPARSLQAARAMTLLGWPKGGSHSTSEHLRWLRRAADAAALAPPAERLRLLVDRATALLLLGDASGWTEAARIPWDAATTSERLHVVRGQANLGEAARIWGRFGEARRRIERAIDLANIHHYPRFRDTGLAALAYLDWLTGDWAELAAQLAVLTGDADIHRQTRLEAVLVRGLLRAANGHRAPAIDDLWRVVEETPGRGAAVNVMDAAAGLARLYLADGDVMRAVEVTAEPAGVVARKGTWIWVADLAPARVAALVAAGCGGEASAFTEAFAAGLSGRDAPAAQAGLVLCLANLAEAEGEHERAAGLFGRAAAAWTALPRPYDALLALERQAGCLVAAGRTGDALSILGDAVERLRTLGARSDANRVARTLQALGAPDGTAPQGSTRASSTRASSARTGPASAGSARRPGRPAYGDRLSPRELEVVRLLAGGSTNRQIAEALVLSRQTVASHVQSAMRKLRVSSRTALAVSATELGLIAGAAQPTTRESSGDEKTRRLPDRD